MIALDAVKHLDACLSVNDSVASGARAVMAPAAEELATITEENEEASK